MPLFFNLNKIEVHHREIYLEHFQVMVNLTKCRSKESPDTCTHFGTIKSKRVCDILFSKPYAAYALLECLNPKFQCPFKKVSFTHKQVLGRNVLTWFICRVCIMEEIATLIYQCSTCFPLMEIIGSSGVVLWLVLKLLVVYTSVGNYLRNRIVYRYVA